jgi:hypothetical protein
MTGRARCPRLFLGLATLGLLAAMSVGLLAGGVRVTAETLPPARTLEDVAARIGLIFPPGSTLENVREDAGRDRSLRAKVALPPGAFEDFLRNNKIDRANFEEGRRVLLGSDSGWWNPSINKSLPTVSLHPAPGRVLQFGAGAVPDGRTMLFIVWFTT